MKWGLRVNVTVAPGRRVVIPQRELAALRAEWILDQGVIEKDYVLGWLLAGIARHTELNRAWIFKGRHLSSQVLLRDIPVLRGP